MASRRDAPNLTWKLHSTYVKAGLSPTNTRLNCPLRPHGLISRSYVLLSLALSLSQPLLGEVGRRRRLGQNVRIKWKPFHDCQNVWQPGENRVGERTAGLKNRR